MSTITHWIDTNTVRNHWAAGSFAFSMAENRHCAVAGFRFDLARRLSSMCVTGSPFRLCCPTAGTIGTFAWIYEPRKSTNQLSLKAITFYFCRRHSLRAHSERKGFTDHPAVYIQYFKHNAFAGYRLAVGGPHSPVCVCWERSPTSAPATLPLPPA